MSRRIFDGPCDPYLGPHDYQDDRDGEEEQPPPVQWQPWYSREET